MANKAYNQRMLNKAVGFVLLALPQKSSAYTLHYKACKLSQIEHKYWTHRKIYHLQLYCVFRSYISHTGLVLSCSRCGFYLVYVSNLVGFASPWSATCHFLNVTLTVVRFLLLLVSRPQHSSLYFLIKWSFYHLCSSQSTVISNNEMKIRIKQLIAFFLILKVVCPPITSFVRDKSTSIF